MLRTPLLVTGAVVLVSIIVMIATAAQTSGPFSPDSTEPSGARALATLLDNHGVKVTGTELLDDAVEPGDGKALLIGPNGSLDRSDWQRIADAGWSHIILIRPGPRYGDGVNHTVIRLESSDRTVDVVGSARSFTNDQLASDGNAALALNLIGTHSQLTWYLPQYESGGTDDADSNGPPLIPPDVRYIGWALAFAVLVIAIWRGRRLGPVVAERLPVIVHAAETTEGRARLYRRSRARDRAASALRESALGKLHKAHGIPRRADPTAVVATVAARTGRDPAMLYELLYGLPPLSDAALMSLSHELDVLTQEVRHP